MLLLLLLNIYERTDSLCSVVLKILKTSDYLDDLHDLVTARHDLRRL